MSTPASVALGDPTFEDPRFSALAKNEGAASAWAAAFADRGVDAARRVGGTFAAGVTDGNGQSFGVVDRFAVRTLCYRIVEGRLHFAERADTLAALHPVAAVDPQALFDYLYFHVIPSPRTVYRGVFRVPPGHGVVHDSTGLTVRAYWVPQFQQPTDGNFDALSSRFRDSLKTAVARQLDGSKPACFLSGGTDSSTVAGMIGLVAGRPASTYSIGFEAEGYDEMAYARLAAQRFKTDHHEYYVTPDDLVASIPDVARHYDQPFGNSSALPAYYCARMARDDGVTRMLAGDGGDELFGGNTRYAKQRVFGWYEQIPPTLRRHLLEPALLKTPVGALPLLKKGRSYIEQAMVPLPDRLQMYNLLSRLGVNTVLEPGFIEQIDIGDPLAQQRRQWSHPADASNLNRMLAFDWYYTLAEADLPKVCGTTAMAGVSVGFPFLDDDLVAFSQRLPDSFKLRRLKLRWFFKESLRGFLPDEILTKKKQGFGLPFGVWANRHDGLRRLAEASLRSLAGRGIVRPDFIEQLLKVHLPAHPGYYGEMVWILMMLEQWIQASTAPSLHL
jgi:asparagine synthase (glutamine-hydrolysing)